ncbi:MAG: M48 family metallopeptidase [Paracoccaceae bacterium]
MSRPPTLATPGAGPWHGAENARMIGRTIWLNGKSPVPETVILRVDGDCLLIETPNETVVWPLDQIRQVRDMAARDVVLLRRGITSTARLEIRAPELAQVLFPLCRNLRRKPPVLGLGRLWAWAGAAVASVGVILLVLVPLLADQLAPMIPPAGERALGEKTLTQIRGALDDRGPVRLCEHPPGVAALAKMQDRLQAHLDLPHGVTVTVLNHRMINAFALPGGQVVLFKGLIRTAQTPEEVAAVLAHELGHVASRDPTRHALRSAGSIGVLGLLFGDFAGGTAVLFLANRLIEANYSQSAEAAADVFARNLLRDAGLQPGALGRMFERMQAGSGEPPAMLKHFLSHPDLAERILASADEPELETLPLLTDAEWQDLRQICRRSSLGITDTDGTSLLPPR